MKFYHDAETIYEAIGLGEEEKTRIEKTVEKAFQTYNSVSDIFEYLIRELKGDEEITLAIVYVGVHYVLNVVFEGLNLMKVLDIEPSESDEVKPYG